MSTSDIDKVFKTKIDFRLPSHNARASSVELSPREHELKDTLMKLIIDTRDEPIELKLTGEHYRKVGIHDEWRQVDFNSNKAAYFSYQEKAAKDFIFRFNKCGILSDQVGMGKTIEAGMIISELAYRKELGSLLTLVPNENMAEKWEVELARKFGFRNFYKDINIIEGKEERKVPASELPKVASIKSLDDLYCVIFSAYDSLYSKPSETLDERIRSAALRVFDRVCSPERLKDIRGKLSELLNTYTQVNGKEFKLEVLKRVYAPLIEDFVKEISRSLGFEKELNASGYKVDLTGPYYHVVDMYLDMPITGGGITNAIMERLIDRELISNSVVGEFKFAKSRRGREIIQRLSRESSAASSNAERVKYIEELKRIAKRIREKYAILIVSKLVRDNGEEQFNLLSFCLNKDYESDSSRYCSVSTIVEKGYRVIDMLIDMSYKTLIVDEAHDYIKVSHKIRMKESVTREKDYVKRQREGIEFSDLDLTSDNTSLSNYFVFPLYNDYYFVNRDCLYLKVKSLAERSYRKIFMTATPIKSDMIDFYLLYLIADNSNTNISSRIRALLNEDKVAAIAGLILSVMEDAYKKAMNYVTYEEIVIKYLYQYYQIHQEGLSGTFDDKINAIIERTIREKAVDKEVLKDICVNDVRLPFQQTFTIKDKEGKDVEINSIADLVSSEEGVEQWQNMYSQIGIRSTRHQTFRLSEEMLKKIKPMQREKYRNLPIWSRRNGTIIYIHKKDNYFDVIVKELLDQKKRKRDDVVDDEHIKLKEEIIDSPKKREEEALKKSYEAVLKEIEEKDYTDALKEIKTEEERKKYEAQLEKLEAKYAPKETALSVYKYINDQLTGELSVADYYSTDVNYDDFKLHMVVKLMTDGLELKNWDQPKKISGKVLLFCDESTQKKVLNWLTTEADPTGKSMTGAELASYVSKFKHQPLWYYNSMRENAEDRWVITNDIKALKEKKGNYLIVVEPNKYEEGVDLQASNILINFDIKFCPLKMEQRIGRIDRVKLSEEQSQLDIISFTPLNDMSGFMVDFLANDLKMFSCWRGDTTGIVSMPLGDKPNSATFENAILAINDAYVNLYGYNGSKFISSCKRLAELGANFSNDNFEKVKALLKQEKQILDDFRYLSGSAPYINKIIFNTEGFLDEKMKDDEIIAFDELLFLAKKNHYQRGEISKESISNHKNDLKELKAAIRDYYRYNIGYLSEQMKGIEQAYSSVGSEKIDTTSGSAEKEAYNQLKSRLAGFESELKAFEKSGLCSLPDSSLGAKKKDVGAAVNPILNRYKSIIIKYLSVLLELFEKFCHDVADKSMKMTKFISYLTIEEFRVMADNYE